MFLVQENLVRAHIKGSALGVGMYDDEDTPELVDGVYEISSINVNGRRETCAFRISGTGPRQIAEPYYNKTLRVTKEERNA